jgi:hypothetical protein
MKNKLLILLIAFPIISFAQSNNMPSTYDVHDLKITGYLQTQFQRAQSEGIKSFSGGDFSENSRDRFMIRRGRLKIDRVDKYSSIVFQIDATQNGVQLMDAFIQLYQPNSKNLVFTAGLFNRPFGHSVIYSSGYRDFPERARVFQTIMPRERDIGAMLGYNPQNNFKFISADIALVNGSGYSSRDYDSKKDIIGNLGFKFDSLASGKLHLGFGGSIYSGYVRNNTDSYYVDNGNGFSRNTNAANEGWYAKREYYGANLQVEYDNTFGRTIFKSEYVGGKQPGIGATADITGPDASESFAQQPATDLYLRSFSGYYFWLTQQIAKSKFTALVAYDVYDPNSKISESEIGIGNNTTAGDIKFSTLGYGMTYVLSSRIKFTLYNEHVFNSKTSLNDYAADLKDDVFTARLQYRW